MLALQGLAGAVILASFGGMTIFAAEHLQNADAPLKPALATASAAPTPAPTAAASSRQQRLSPQVPLTRRPAVTRTHSS